MGQQQQVPSFELVIAHGIHKNSPRRAQFHLKMPRQVLELSDYFAPLAALIMFALAILVFSFFVINFFYITDRDDLTVFEKFGAHLHLCLGPHSMSDIYRGGPRNYPQPQGTDKEMNS
ncbi:hypothetical protein niasHT_026295 [Heterodera trifolii]|uniref:Uncharacterized protein n=1 Tax=Heterodera trifolii TaxID=157864 RepID=A0ABD2JVB9_9BILA